jgi:tight adherence protein C
LQRWLGGRASLERRLERAGSSLSVETFRFSQVLWALAGFGVCLAIGVLGPGREPGRAVPWLLISCGAGALGVMARDSALSRAVRSREQRMLNEFPVVADLLALSVAAGEGLVACLDRVVRSCHGVLPDELAVVLAQSRTGVPLTEALDRLSRRTGVPIVARFAEGVAVAIERGTPLVDVLTAQAGDVREASRRELIEAGARKEVAMMVPVVFLIMPVTLLFAFFPGVVGLNLLAP